MSTGRIGIIQLSDTQFGPKQAFEDVLRFAQTICDDVKQLSVAKSFQPLYLLGTGDLAEYGNRAEFDVAVTAFDTLCEKLTIDKSNALFVPGNHDVNWKLSEAGEACGNPRVKLANYYAFLKKFYAQTNRALEIDGSAFSTLIDSRNGLAFLLLDSCEKESHSHHGGWVDLAKLNKAIQVLSEGHYSPQTLLKIAVVHHRLDTGIHSAPECIENQRDLEAILIANKFHVVLTGHIHEAMHYSINSDGWQVVYSGSGSTGVNLTQRADGVPNQYTIHVADRNSSVFESYFRAFNPKRKTAVGLGGWTEDTTYSEDSCKFNVSWIPAKRVAANIFVEDKQISTSLGIRKNPFLISNAEKIQSELVLQLFVNDESRHRGANRLSGDAIIRGKRGAGKTMCLRYLDAFGSLQFRRSITEKTTAECFPVFVSMADIHPSEVDGPPHHVYRVAEDLIYDRITDAFARADDEIGSQEFRAALYKLRQRLKVLENQAGSKLAKLGIAIREHMTRIFDHVLILLDEIASAFPKQFFQSGNANFSQWMNTLRSCGPFNTRITIYPHDLSDTLNEDRFGSIVNLEYNIRNEIDFRAFRKYATELVNRYLLSVAINSNSPPSIASIVYCNEGSPDDALEQILYASDGSSRRLMRLIEKCIDHLVSRSGDSNPLTKEETLDVISTYSSGLTSSMSETEISLAGSIAKACIKRGTFRFQVPLLTQAVKNLHSAREELNIISIVQLGAGSRGNTYEFNYPYCIERKIPTHHLRDSGRICATRDAATGMWIDKVTKLSREDLDFFEACDRLDGEVIECKDGWGVVRGSDEKDYISDAFQQGMKVGDHVSFVANEEVAFDILPL